MAETRTDFHLDPAAWTLDSRELLAIRDAVFVAEQGVPEDIERDDDDAHARHVLARNAGGAPIGCARMVDGRIGRMAVLPGWRGRGVGSAMLRHLLEIASATGRRQVSLHAQVDALPFYRKHGFRPEGDRFLEAGIEHQLMTCAVEPPALRRPAAIKDHPQPEPLACDSSKDMCRTVTAILRQARHRIDVLSPALAPLLPDDDAVLAEVRRLATSGRQARLRILIHDADPILRAGHRFIDLAQRLDSAIRVRSIVDADDLAYPSGLLLNDVGGYLLQPNTLRPEATGCSHAPGDNGRLMRDFDALWQRAVPATSLRLLQL